MEKNESLEIKFGNKSNKFKKGNSNQIKVKKNILKDKSLTSVRKLGTNSLSRENQIVAIKRTGWKRLIELFKSKSKAKSFNSSKFKQNHRFLDDSRYEYVDNTSKLSLLRYETDQTVKPTNSNLSQINNQRFRRKSSEQIIINIRKAMNYRIRKNKKLKSQNKPIEYETLMQNVNKENNYFLYLLEDLIEFSFNDHIERDDFMKNGFKKINEDYFNCNDIC
jgi:hypothetical protein